MPQYYGSQGPAQYAMRQQSRQDQQMQNMLRMMMQLRAMKQDRTQWEQGQAMKQQEFALDKEQLKSIDQHRKAQERYQQHLMEPKPLTPSATMKTIEYMVDRGIAPNAKAAYDMYKGFKDPDRIRVEAQAKAEGTAAGKPPTQTKQTAYDKQIAKANQLFDEGKISQEVLDRKTAGLSPPQSEDEKIRKGYSTRDKNLAFVSKAHAKVDVKDMKKQIKGVSGAFPTVDGVRVDMPTKYGTAVMNTEDRVATPEDEAIIRKYDKMFQAFIGNVLPTYNSFKEFATDKAKGKDWDMKQVKRWFDIYR